MNQAYRIFVFIGFFVWMITGTGCREIVTTTVIHQDGSCVRTVRVTSSSQEMSSSAFPVPTDSSWEITTTKSRSDSSRFVYTATKSFTNVEDLAAEYLPKDSSRLHLDIQITLQKNFQWFFTYFTYTESYKKTFPFNKVPISSYITPEELDAYLNNQDSTGLKDKISEYETRSIYEEFYQGLLGAIKTHPAPGIDSLLVIRKKEQLYQTLLNSEDADSSNEFADTFIPQTAQVLGASLPQFVRDTLRTITKHIETKLDFFGDINANSYHNILVMPGTVLRANADSTSGDTITWNLDGKEFSYQDYSMWAESRVTNWGTVIIAALIVMLFFSLSRKMQSTGRKSVGTPEEGTD